MDERLRGPRVRKLASNLPPLRFLVDKTLHPPVKIHTNRKEPVFGRQFPVTLPPILDKDMPMVEWTKGMPSGLEPDTRAQDFIQEILRAKMRAATVGSRERAWRQRDLENWERLGRPTYTRPVHGRKEQ